MKTFTKMSLIAALACSAAVVNAQDDALPTYDPPVPTYPTEDVAAIYAPDKYGEVEMTDPGWGSKARFAYAGTASGNTGVLQIVGMDEEQPADDTNTLYEWVAMNLNPSVTTKDYTYLHVDVYCNEATDFRIGFQTWYVPSTGAQLECYFPAIESESMEPGKWYSIDIPLTELKYTQADNQPTLNWEGAAAAMLRIGNGPDLFDYAHVIYAANISEADLSRPQSELKYVQRSEDADKHSYGRKHYKRYRHRRRGLVRLMGTLCLVGLVIALAPENRVIQTEHVERRHSSDAAHNNSHHRREVIACNENLIL